MIHVDEIRKLLDGFRALRLVERKVLSIFGNPIAAIAVDKVI